MPNGEIISTERFSEFGKAYDVLKNTEKFEKEIKERVDKSKKPILFVEGDFDVRYLKRAADLLGKADLLNQIEIYPGDGFGNLDKICKNFDSKLSDVVTQRILLLYDCDTGKTDSNNGKVFKKLIPSINTNIIKKGIENLFPIGILKKAMAYKLAFIDHTPSFSKTERGIEITEPEKHEVNKSEKNNLCTWLCENGTKEDFENFSNIFKIIEDTLFPKTG